MFKILTKILSFASFTKEIIKIITHESMIDFVANIKILNIILCVRIKIFLKIRWSMQSTLGASCVDKGVK